MLLSRNQLKILAFLTMIIDHIGAILFPSVLVFRIIGRLSFPIFAYLLAKGMHDSRAPLKMVIRLFFFAILSQPAYSIAFDHVGLYALYSWNIFLTLSIAAFCCWLISKNSVIGFLILILSCVLSETVIAPDYQAYGIVLVVMFYLIEQRKPNEFLDESLQDEQQTDPWMYFFYILLLTFIHLAATMGSPIQAFASFAGLFMPAKKKQENPIGKWAYIIYPGHLLILWLFKIFFVFRS